MSVLLFIRGMELACIQELAYILELDGKLGQLCELGLGHKKQFLHRQLPQRFQSRHQQCYRLQFEFCHRATKHDIVQMLNNHRGAHCVQNLLHCNHLAQHTHSCKLLAHLHKLVLFHKLELELDMELEVRRQRQQPKEQSKQ